MVSSDSENFGKNRQKIVDFWPKNRVFYVFSASAENTPTLQENSIMALENGPTGLKTGIHVPWDSSKKSMKSFLSYLRFLGFFGAANVLKGPFFG